MTSQEDDATELQFPKEVSTLNYEEDLAIEDELLCCSCSAVLMYPFIQCSDCESVGEKINLCLQCFSKGDEFHCHRNDHSYIIQQNSTIFSTEWKATEELHLLSEAEKYGIGNWNAIGKALNKNPKECKAHYYKTYIEYPCEDLLTIIKCESNLKPRVPYYPNFGTEDPPRPTANSALSRDMANYNAARGDFGVEYLNDAENLVQNLGDEEDSEKEDSLDQELKLVMLDIYRRKIGDREMKRRVIAQHGLINFNKTNILHNHYKSLCPKYSNLMPLLHNLMSHEDLIKLLESLSYEKDLENYIMDLKECRINGITKQEQVSIYDTLKKKREITRRKKYKLILTPELSNINVKDFINSTGIDNKLPSSLKRRTSAPLDITGEPEFDTLNSIEKELSSSLRILPVKFNKIKFDMIEECRKLNGLQLRHARSICKIDVNKVRKIYDYLLGEGLVYRPLPTK